MRRVVSALGEGVLVTVMNDDDNSLWSKCAKYKLSPPFLSFFSIVGNMGMGVSFGVRSRQLINNTIYSTKPYLLKHN